MNRGNVLRFAEARADEFLAYDEFNPMRQVFLNADGTPSPTPTSSPFLLNFNAGEGPAVAGSTPQVFTDGNDMMFGDLGNDWMVGGTGRDWMFGGFGADLLNADDDQTSAGGENNVPDGPQSSYEDFAYGGAGRDVLIANTGGDRLIDWVGEFNSYLVPFSPFGMSTISRMISPALQQFLYDLSRGAGADRTRAADTGADPLRNGEPCGQHIGYLCGDLVWLLPDTAYAAAADLARRAGVRLVSQRMTWRRLGEARLISADPDGKHWTVRRTTGGARQRVIELPANRLRSTDEPDGLLGHLKAEFGAVEVSDDAEGSA